MSGWQLCVGVVAFGAVLAVGTFVFAICKAAANGDRPYDQEQDGYLDWLERGFSKARIDSLLAADEAARERREP